MAEVPVHIWYPAVAETGRLLKQADYVSLGFDRYSPASLSNEQRRLAVQSAQRTLEFSSAPALDVDKFSLFLESPVTARLGASPAAGKWPLLICGIEGSDRSGDLAEKLASRGYIVATFVSPAAIGAMQVNRPQQTIEHLARTMESLLGEMRRRPGVDATRVGVVSLNFNSLGALVFQMRTGAAKTLISLDGLEAKTNGVQHLLGNVWFAPTKLTVPYLVYVQDEPAGVGAPPLDQTLFNRFRYADRTWIQVRGMRHANHFPANNLLPGQRQDAVIGYAEMVERIAAVVDANVRGDGPPAGGGLPSFAHFSHHEPLPAMPDETELDRRMMADLRGTLKFYADAMQRDPELDVLTESSFDLYAFRYSQRKATDDVIAIRRAVAEMFPASWRASLKLAAALQQGSFHSQAAAETRIARKRLAADLTVNPQLRMRFEAMIDEVGRDAAK